MKRLYILSILIMMMVYNECSKCTEYKETKTNAEEPKSSGGATKSSGQQENTPTTSSRRRLVVEEKTCSALATSDDKKKKCVVNKDKTGCEEVDKDSSSMIKIPLFLLISLLFI